ncbi:hypothetical protein PFISCL1PPCAC_2977 [Pristionchus fissidentatus]|uniref:Uncharacterized protein n=1 Tax=Pristionchus fissidentatus TaxID=1538716 RepID=A0AAV5UZM2_9BILA|nr:hypothetical protein PFISCL1PPCAC_2977 [Pristionchus fissidentatus]
MDWKYIRGTGRPGGARVPPNFYADYCSSGYAKAPRDAWVSGRFSPFAENILMIGGDSGHVCIVDVEAPTEDAFKYYFRAHQGTVMDVIPIPNQPDELLTMSGYDIRIWSLGSPIKSTLFCVPEDVSVRCASFIPDNSNVFASGGRDGSIYMWDKRIAATVQNSHMYRRPVKEYRHSHVVKPVLPLTPAGVRKRSDRLSYSVPSITEMLFLDEHTLATCSSSGKSGIRMWDTRKMPVREESRPLTVFELPYSKKDAGVSSICLDRFKSSLFAVSTDNCIYEYAVHSACVKPLRSYTGACMDGDLHIQAACSPVSDHLICGSGDRKARLWDMQKFHSYSDEHLSGPASASSTAITPSLALGGHNKKVGNVGFSVSGKYMLTMDDSEFRIWQRLPVSSIPIEDSEQAGAATFERVERIVPTRADEASNVLQSFSITPGPRLFLSPTKAGMAPLQKRKEPFASPFKKTARALFDRDGEKENTPPGYKMARLDDVSLPSLEDGEEERKKEAERKRRRRNPFYYKHPTMHLPNAVYERHVAKLRGVGQQPVVETETVTKSGRKMRTLECWARSAPGARLSKERLPSIEEFPDSMFSSSPKKQLTVVRPLQLLQQQQPVAAAAPGAVTTPKAKGRRSSVRNILDYFQTNKASGDH